ncbi:DUF1883 domain-containing protein [Nonomuraea sp. NPDC050394]|uniref:DUF1883 domain-containing protein n=1 Tax=Nonomuraea sp. NPDC050394 TaxID=3364363 RepID=UPI0037BE0AFE
MRHLYWNLGSVAFGARFAVEVRGSACRVCLMDAEEYEAYLDEDAHEYYGGFFDAGPAVVEVPYDDDWYLVVDSYSGSVNVVVSQLFD